MTVRMNVPIRVLLVEDSEDDADLVFHELRHGGYDPTCERVCTADALTEALGRDAWDIVLCDYAMPQFSGLAALALVQRHAGDLPVIVVSGEISQEIAVATIKAGALDYVMKTNLAGLAPAVERALREAETRRERRRVEEALKSSEERYRALVENLNELVFTMDAEGNLTYVSPASVHVAAYPADEMIGRPFRTFVHPDDLPGLQSSFERTLGGQLEPHEFRVFDKQGRIRHVSTSSRLRREGEKVVGLTGILTDITARKQAEEEVRRLNAELEQRVQERTLQLETANEELEAFTYSVSHDLRTLLRVIDGFSHVLLQEHAESLDEEGRQHLGRVREGTERMNQLVTDLLTLSQASRNEMRWEEVDLSALVQAIATELQRTEPERRVEFCIADGVLVRGDAGLLGVALQNLLGNAWKFTGKHPAARIEFGTIGVGGSHDADSLPSASVTDVQAELDNHQPVYFISDDGAGFDPEYADKLFGAFRRLHGPDEFEGTGVGLATAQRIFHRHGGRVWAEGAVEKGATFYFTLSDCEKPNESGN